MNPSAPSGSHGLRLLAWSAGGALQEYHALAPEVPLRRAGHPRGPGTRVPLEAATFFPPAILQAPPTPATITAAPRPAPPPTRFGGAARSFETEAEREHRKLRSPPRCLIDSRPRLSLEAQHGRRRGRPAAHGPGGAQAEPGEVKERQLDLAFGSVLEIAAQDAGWAAKRRRWRSAWAQTADDWHARGAGVQDASAPRP